MTVLPAFGGKRNSIFNSVDVRREWKQWWSDWLEIFCNYKIR
jgi:hypothetical protein